MIKLRDGSAIVIEPKGTGLNIVLKSKTPVANKNATANNDAKQDGNKQDQTFVFTLPMSMVPVFYGSLFGKNYFATKNNQQYSLVVMHAGMQRRPRQDKANETQAPTNDKGSTLPSATSLPRSTQSTQPSAVSSTLPGASDTPSTAGVWGVSDVQSAQPLPTQTSVQTPTQTPAQTEKKKDQIRDLELVNLLVYEKQEGGKRAPKYLAKFTISRVNILRLKQEIKKAMKQSDKWALRLRSMTLTKAGSVMILSQNANQLIIDYSNKDEIKDDLTEFVMSTREEYTISRIKFSKDDAMTLLSLLTHFEI
jgi:hypothetical protein